ncbi:hypothetical protein ASPZODRAFT_58983 [Penicilliopsis zonata CBS 506.65]|uniref:Zn(2)-C6 fungal-type domain-containing protein n=1 Tax=Penicilliopsis zonata CBS 506.65 TaxID=1073090 RepID=A0A1L9SSZ5_9EURO|nr:hypothetical protein ASPZODRAFT_58983 [Penicilliopsis zonata CBS 506.65]OJJ50328.1 hypothetical protein ASPZODRAFT_58983 [Penicilliopsis zonata CBS 506.65]
MSQRKFHHKSRLGCLQCKRNRTKCDENKPKCGRCARIGAECSLAESLEWVIMTDNTASSSGASTGSKENSSPEDLKASEEDQREYFFAEEERDRLRLMHHYTLHTAKSISDLTGPEEAALWNEWTVELALANDFLLHGILSISALHLALRETSPQRKHILLAIHHHDLGVALFRPHLAHIARDKQDAVFAFSCMVLLYAFGIQRLSESSDTPLAKIIQVLLLVRNSISVIKSDHTAMAHSRWSVLMLDPSRLLLLPSPPAEIEEMLATLRLRVPAESKEHQHIYTCSIQALRHALNASLVYQNTRMTLVFFLIASPAGLWKLVAEEEPLALAILANYAVILYWIRDHIWMVGWGEETIEAVAEALPLDWHGCIAWAVGQTGRSVDSRQG